MRKITFEDAAEELHSLVRECGADCLAAMYEYAFGAVSACDESPNGDYLEVEYHEGLEPYEPELCDIESLKNARNSLSKELAKLSNSGVSPLNPIFSHCHAALSNLDKAVLRMELGN